MSLEIREITMTFSKIKAKKTRELTRTLEKTLEAKLACSDTAVIEFNTYWFNFTPVDSRLEIFIN
jgi:hypothetical protein